MSTRRSLSTPITLAIIMFVALAVLTVGWVLLNVFSGLKGDDYAPLYWTLLTIGSALLVVLIVGVALHLALSIKAINLTRRQSNFIDSVTHELKSPIASMKLYLQTLNRYQVSQQEQNEFHRFMLEDLARLDHLINQMLDAGRLDEERPKSENEDVDLAPLLADCAAAVAMNYHVATDTVQLQLEPVTVLGRRVDLDVVFRNLIDNAVKYAGAPPMVSVSLRRTAGGMAVVQITDNGRGIPPHLRRKIFGRFVRLGSELEREKPGTGLGLYIVRTLIRQMHGSVRVRDPEQKKPGTVFEVQLPAKKIVK